MQYLNNYSVNLMEGVSGMKDESLLIDTKPSAVILLPHIILMLFFVGFITIWKPLFSLISTNIRITTKKITAKKGIISVECMDSPLSKITSVKISQNLFGKIFNYGSIYINVMDSMYVFDYIPDVEKIKNLIMENTN